MREWAVVFYLQSSLSAPILGVNVHISLSKVLIVFITVYLISLLVIAIKREFSFFSSLVLCNSCSSVIELWAVAIASSRKESLPHRR